MPIWRSRVAEISDVTVNQDIDFLTLYQAKNLASPASGEALRKGHKDIKNAEVSDTAAIGYAKLNLTAALLAADIAAAEFNVANKLVKLDASADVPQAQIPILGYAKLNLTDTLLAADIAAAEFNAANKLVKLDASADVPDAQIPNLAAGKVTSGRFPLARLGWTADKLLKGAGATNDPTEIDVPAAPTKAWLYENLVADGVLFAVEADVTAFQLNPATGTFGSSPEDINNNVVAEAGRADNIGEYAEVDFGKVVGIKRWRHYGHDNNNDDGTWKIEFWNLATEAWEDWVTGIATRGASWTVLATEAIKVTTKIRLTAESMDTAGNNRCGELEVIY